MFSLLTLLALVPCYVHNCCLGSTPPSNQWPLKGGGGDALPLKLGVQVEKHPHSRHLRTDKKLFNRYFLNFGHTLSILNLGGWG